MHSNDPKNQSIRAFIKGVQADVIGMVELGICWSQLPTKDRIWERTRGWFESIKTVTAYNQKEASPNKAQWGGTSVWSIDNAVHRAIESGSDTLGLGRWSWTRYRGRGNITLRIISAYRPCDSRGPLTVYSQHQNYFDDEDIEGCPRELFTAHLIADIEKWISEGDQIILMIDANEDIRSFAQAIQRTGLREVLLERHGQNAPATYNGGSVPIDGIFASQSIEILVGGYFEFGFCPPTDHRGLWLDIHYQVAFGHVMPAVVSPQARRLKTTDPRIVQRYTDSWSQFIVQHDMLARAYAVQQTCTYPLSQDLQDEWEALDELRNRRHAVGR
jgi:hypothetical protein